VSSNYRPTHYGIRTGDAKWTNTPKVLFFIIEMPHKHLNAKPFESPRLVSHKSCRRISK